MFWVGIPAYVANGIGVRKHRTGWPYGLLLGWIGVLVIALIPALADPTLRECPHCKEPMRPDASVCPHCQRDVPPLSPAVA